MQCRWVWLGCGFLAVNGNGVLHYAVQVVKSIASV